MIRRLYLIILMAITAITGLAQQPQTGDYIYVYEKDGNVEAFLREEIVEMGYSHDDTLGVTHDEVVSQVILLEDAAHIYPLEAIDSISFVTPATVLKPGVTDLAPTLAQYAVGSKELTLYLSASTPQSLLPAIGQRVVLAERSFAGDVASITQEDGQIVVKATMVDLEDIFETYYATEFFDIGDDGAAQARTKARGKGKDFEKTIKLPAIGFEINQEAINLFLPGDDELPVEAKFSAKVQPTFTIKASTVVNKGKTTSVSVVGDFKVDEQLAFSGKIEESFDLVKPIDAIDIPLGQTFLFFYNTWGAQLKATCELSLDLKWQQLYRATFDWSYNSKDKKVKLPEVSFKKVSEDFTPEGSIKGSIMIGPYTDIGIKFVCTELAKAALHLEAGQVTGGYVLLNKDIVNASNSTRLYELLKAQKVELNFVVNSSIDLSFLNKSQSIDLPWKINNNLATYDYVPTFSNMEFVESSGSGETVTADASATVSGKCMAPMTVGFVVSDKDGNSVDNWNANDKHKSEEQNINKTFDKLKDGNTYVLNPKVVILGYDILATPAVNLEKDKFPVRITDFKQSDAKYSKKQGYEYEGRYYYYKFNAITTVEVDRETQKVKDWGYIYHDIYGVDKKISCANLGSNPYPDARYAYYYNERSRTVSLTPYIQYEGESDIKRGKEKIYRVEYVYSGMSSCPDEHHPHAIDLGLPSGTLWACCNVGAEEPEGFGTYYQSGNPGNGMPAFQSNDDTYEFAGTMFDPATVEWGVEWATPNSDQMDELVKYCTHEGKYGFPAIDGSQFIFPKELGGNAYVKVYGPNGNYILMPAAGIKNADGTYKDGYQPTYLHTDGVFEGSWDYHGAYWTDYNDGEFVTFLDFSNNYFTDRSLQKNQEYEFDFMPLAGRDLLQALPIRPVINKNQGMTQELNRMEYEN